MRLCGNFAHESCVRQNQWKSFYSFPRHEHHHHLIWALQPALFVSKRFPRSNQHYPRLDMGNTCCRSTANDDHEARCRILNSDNCDTEQTINHEDGQFYIINNSNNQQGIYPGCDEMAYGSFSNGNKSQEQAALDLIYHRLTLNVIDVAPGETMIIQPAEFLERRKAYRSGLSQLRAAVPPPPPHAVRPAGGHKQPISGFQMPDRRRVEYEPIGQDEVELIGEYSHRSIEAVENLAPTVNEPVISQFNL